MSTTFDQLIWDVGRRLIPHKIRPATGRRDKIRHHSPKGGRKCPFPWRRSGIRCVLSVGHSLPHSISAGIGICRGGGEKSRSPHRLCDWHLAPSPPVAFEAMNHAGDIPADMLVILNDNEMSISGKRPARSATIWRSYFPTKLYSSLREKAERSSPAYRR